MEPLPVDNCSHCEVKVALFDCEHCRTVYCSDKCSAADYAAHKWLCFCLAKVSERLQPLLRGHGWIFPDPNLSIFHEDVIKTFPGEFWRADYKIFLQCIVEAAYLYSQMPGNPSRAKALEIFESLAKAPVLLNRRILNRIIPALQIEFGRDETGSWPFIRNADLRNNEQIQARKGKSLAPRLVCQEDEWYHSHDPGLIAIRILLLMKTLWGLEDVRRSCLLDPKLPKELELEVEKNMLRPAMWNRLNGMKIVHDMGSPMLLGKRIRKLRQRIRKNIRRIHVSYPYFFPSFFTAENVMAKLPVHEFLPENFPLWTILHKCGWGSCDLTAHMHSTQVAYTDIYRAYESTPGAIDALRGLIESSIEWLSEIEPYLQELDAYEVSNGDELHAVHASNAMRRIPVYRD